MKHTLCICGVVPCPGYIFSLVSRKPLSRIGPHGFTFVFYSLVCICSSDIYVFDFFPPFCKATGDLLPLRSVLLLLSVLLYCPSVLQIDNKKWSISIAYGMMLGGINTLWISPVKVTSKCITLHVYISFKYLLLFFNYGYMCRCVP